mmetsp:Transcript_10180/g.11722  ORF Transcript_10180/g.11722 Transcript_10180/m.11722 type:complete len:578 (-) Transcript_10180:891-2624(-)
MNGYRRVGAHTRRYTSTAKFLQSSWRKRRWRRVRDARGSPQVSLSFPNRSFGSAFMSAYPDPESVDSVSRDENQSNSFEKPGVSNQKAKTMRKARMSRSLSTRYGSFSPSDIIIKKRDGQSLTTEELHWFVDGFHKGYVKDYQMSAFLMAVCVKGMSNREVSDLTLAMVHTGLTADLTSIRPGDPKVDKHSTGGVGDKVSLVLTPLAATLGLVVPMMSGRGLGHTGGTLDKLSAIPGLRTMLESEEYLSQLEKVGCAIVAPTDEYAPVDRTIYALRDVSGSVENVALVASSVMSKKLAEKPDGLLLDVKMGGGAFFRHLNDAAALASTMVAIGEDAGIATCCVVTNMDQPLGAAVGNWLETREALQLLQGKDRAPLDEFPSSDEALKEIEELALAEASLMLGLGGMVDSYQEGYNLAKQALDSGKCLHKFAEMVESQGGDPRVVYDLNKIPLPKYRKTMYSPIDGIIEDIDAHEIGIASVKLGAGRHYADDEVDFCAGLLLHKKVGSRVKKGEPIFTAFASDVASLEEPEDRLNDGYDRAEGSFLINPDCSHVVIKEKKLIEYFVDRTGVQPFEIIK